MMAWGEVKYCEEGRLCIVACLPVAFEHNNSASYAYGPAAFLILYLHAFLRPHPSCSSHPTISTCVPTFHGHVRVDAYKQLCLSCLSICLSRCPFVHSYVTFSTLSLSLVSPVSVCISIRSDDKINSAQNETKTVLDLNLCFLLA